MTAIPTRHRQRWAWQLGFVLLVLAAAAGLLVGPYQFLLGTATGSTTQAARPAPCLPGQPVDIMDSPHISPVQADAIRYSSQPPTSGPHFSFTVATGVYEQPVADGLTVHAMEHGHVIIHYAPGLPASQRADLQRLARRYGADVVLTPHPGLAAGIALTAWGQIDHLDQFDEPRITAFVVALRGRYQHGWSTDQDC